MNTLNHYPPLPDFINNKINFYLDGLINTNKNGKHLVLGKRPQSGDLVLQSNDYLDLSNNPDIIDHHINSIMARKNSPFMSGIFLQDESSKPEVEENSPSMSGFNLVYFLNLVGRPILPCYKPFVTVKQMSTSTFLLICLYGKVRVSPELTSIPLCIITSSI